MYKKMFNRRAWTVSNENSRHEQLLLNKNWPWTIFKVNFFKNIISFSECVWYAKNAKRLDRTISKEIAEQWSKSAVFFYKKVSWWAWTIFKAEFF